MNYEKRYKEALERARDLMTNQNPPAFDKDLISIVFPELAESEDERIRKVLIDYFNEYKKLGTCGSIMFNGIPTDNIIAWLEKQKQIDEEEFKQGALKYVALQFRNWLDKEIPEDEMCLSNAECKVIEDAFLREDWTSISHYMQEKLEKQGGQKPADKVEPKFKVGYWVVDGCGHVWKIRKIIEVYNQCYLLEDVEGSESLPSIEYVNKTYHLWTIEDAKDGDVLCYHCPTTAFFQIAIFKRVASKDELWGGTYRNHVQYGGFGGIENHTLQVALGNDDLHHCGSIACPATKEQRDLLFRKMGEAGYKWDSEKKEPKRIVSKTLDTNQIKKQDVQKFTDVGQKFHKGDYEDGIYLCYEDGYKKPFPTPYPLAAETTPHGLVTHIGIKVGEHKVGLKLNSLGEHELPYDSGLGSDDFGYKKQEIYALYDYDGEANTDRLERHGEFEFGLGDDEWIPALGELAIIYKNRDKLNKALAFVGGDELVEDWHWSSTEYSAISAWFVNFCNGDVSNTHKSDGPVIRPVCVF